MMLTTYYFLAGASGKRDFWQPVMQRLKSSNLIMHQIDYPSFAGCPAHSNVNSFTDLSDYVFNQIQHPSVIIAQSMGGLFAIRAALEKPNVQALVHRNGCQLSRSAQKYPYTCFTYLGQ